jgi:hypothetical protein
MCHGNTVWSPNAIAKFVIKMEDVLRIHQKEEKHVKVRIPWKPSDANAWKLNIDDAFDSTKFRGARN